jgi:hypothetical protein
MVTFHSYPTATLLTSGRVLIAGGDIGDGDGPSAVAEVYDPDTGIFTTTGSMTSPREGHTSTLLADGTVLVAGAHNGGTRTPGGGTDNFSGAELYDPTTGQFHTTNFVGTGRDDHRATALKDGQVLITGGSQYYPFGAGERPRVYGLLSSAELYMTYLQRMLPRMVSWATSFYCPWLSKLSVDRIYMRLRCPVLDDSAHRGNARRTLSIVRRR